MKLVRNKDLLLLKGSAFSRLDNHGCAHFSWCSCSLGCVCEELGSELHGQNSHVPAQHGAQILVGIVTAACDGCTAVGGGPKESPEPAPGGPGAWADLLQRTLLRDVCSAHTCFQTTVCRNLHSRNLTAP